MLAQNVADASPAAPISFSTSGYISYNGSSKEGRVQDFPLETLSLDRTLINVRRSGNTSGLQTHKMGSPPMNSLLETMRESQDLNSFLGLMKVKKSWNSVLGIMNMGGIQR